MPTYLEPPALPTRGPDGQGWNRISLGYYGSPGAQCALRPRSYAALWEVTHRPACAQFGPYDPCVRHQTLQVNRPVCTDCPFYTRPSRRLDTDDDRVMVRIKAIAPSGFGLASQEERIPYVISDPSATWDTDAQRWSWTDLVHLGDWAVGRRGADEHSEFFWLERLTEPS